MLDAAPGLPRTTRRGISRRPPRRESVNNAVTAWPAPLRPETALGHTLHRSVGRPRLRHPPPHPDVAGHSAASKGPGLGYGLPARPRVKSLTPAWTAVQHPYPIARDAPAEGTPWKTSGCWTKRR